MSGSEAQLFLGLLHIYVLYMAQVLREYSLEGNISHILAFSWILVSTIRLLAKFEDPWRSNVLTTFTQVEPCLLLYIAKSVVEPMFSPQMHATSFIYFSRALSHLTAALGDVLA